VGAITGCPSYPSKSDLYNAPYYCAIQIGELLTALGVPNKIANLKGDINRDRSDVSMDPLDSITEEGLSSMNKDASQQEYLTIRDALRLRGRVSERVQSLGSYPMGLSASPFNTDNLTLDFTILTDYLTGNMTNNCQRRCYQRYITQGNILFQGSCRSEVLSSDAQTNYKFLGLLSLHQELRNQICGKCAHQTDNDDEIATVYDNAAALNHKVLMSSAGTYQLHERQLYWDLYFHVRGRVCVTSLG